jgi:excisionase family DNA binding protein
METEKNESDSRLKFYTSAEVAEILKMNPQVIARKLLAGEIAGYKIGKDWRVSEAQLFEFLEKHSNKKTDPESKIVETFFEDGRLKSIPTKRSKRILILKYLVSQLDSNKIYTEDEINKFLSAYHSDVCTLRREFIMNKLMVRKNGKYKVVTWNL